MIWDDLSSRFVTHVFNDWGTNLGFMLIRIWHIKITHFLQAVRKGKMLQPHVCLFSHFTAVFLSELQLWLCHTSPGKKNTCLKLFKRIKLPDTESSAVLLGGSTPAKRLYFYSPSCLTHSSIFNLFLSYSLRSLSPAPPLPPSHSLPLPLFLPSHYHSLVTRPGLVLTVLVSIRGLPPGCGPGCVWSNRTEICSHFSLCVPPPTGFSSKRLSTWCWVPFTKAHNHLLTFN